MQEHGVSGSYTSISEALQRSLVKDIGNVMAANMSELRRVFHSPFPEAVN
jgi:hypothetical protein